MSAIAQLALTKPVCTVAKAQAAKPAARAGHVALGSTRFMGSTAQLSASARQMPVRQLTALVAALEVDEAPAAAPAQKKMSMSRRDRVRERGPSDARDAREGELPLGASCNARTSVGAHMCIIASGRAWAAAGAAGDEGRRRECG